MCVSVVYSVAVLVSGQDSLVDAGTGSGKTLPIALNILLDDPVHNGISLTILPLKRLQVTQVSPQAIKHGYTHLQSQENDFNSKYGIPTISVNNETPREDQYWQVGLFLYSEGLILYL
jgi:hypothetical protein